MTRNDSHLVDNFLYCVMTQSERALDRQDAGEMAEALRTILQACGELRRQRLIAVSPALPSQMGSPANLSR
jgi:hypothetical protein